MGYVDEDGWLFIVGRSKNVINFAGMKIFPYEVESVLHEHPYVGESRVKGMPFPGFGEVPVAEIVLREDAELPENWRMELRRWCFRRLAEYKVPKDFIIVDSLPHTASGKLIRR